MTIREAMLSSARLPVLGMLFLLLTAQMMVVIAAFRDGRSRRFRGALLAPFLLSAVIFWLCLCVIGWRSTYPDWIPEPPAWLAAVFACPVRAVWVFEVVIAAVLCFAVRDTLRYRKRHVTQESVKQAMDLLPMGIAFGEPDGTVPLRNLVMDRLSEALTGKLLTDWQAFQAASGNQAFVADKVWQLRRVETPGSDPVQLTATDITEQAGILADLQEKNRKLKDVRLRLQMYNRQAERIIIAQELLTARMTVHDELGHILLESRHYMRDPKAFNASLLLQTLKNTNTSLLREYEQDDTARDDLADAIDMAETIGVEVTVAGPVPREEPGRGLLAAAIQECAANAVKHAGGSALNVRIRQEENGTLFSLESDGKPPSGPIREAGGLMSLRALTESRGGRMDVESVPAFRLVLFLPAAPDTDKI